MKKILYIIICMPLMFLSACDVHEWPDVPEQFPLTIIMDYDKAHLYDTDMTPWEHHYDGTEIVELGYGGVYDNRRDYGTKRYIIRAYPISMKQRTVQPYAKEFIIERDIENGYDYEMTIDLAPGDYDIMVWSDMVPEGWIGDYFYNADNFTEISLQGEHYANSEWRDAFRGTTRVSIQPYVTNREPDCIEVEMQRPLAKFEFVTNDIVEFINKESVRVASKANGNKAVSNDDTSTRAVNIEDYKVVFYYVGFMPNAYSIVTDKPVDSSTGVMFESSLRKLSESEATMGFDYVFVNGKKSAVTVQIGIYDNEGTQLSLTEPIEVPLKRSHHTIMKGMFLMSEASGGVAINPDFDGDHNLIFP